MHEYVFHVPPSKYKPNGEAIIVVAMALQIAIEYVSKLASCPTDQIQLVDETDLNKHAKLITTYRL